MRHATAGLIPRPTTATPRAGALGTDGRWAFHTDDPVLRPVAATLAALLAPHLAPHLARRPGDDSGGRGPRSGDDRRITLALGEVPSAAAPLGLSPTGGPEPADEAYLVTVTEHGIDCRARTAEGVFRAATTAAQLIATSAGELACVTIADAPRYAWRGLMLDPARAFLGVEDLLRAVDLAALYKLNVLHLHLTDNQAWRLHLPGVPELTGPPADDSAGQGHYTPDDYRALQDYAAERFVTVVPEIDLPGHSASLRRAFPALALPQIPGSQQQLMRKIEAVAPFAPPLDLGDPDTLDTVARVLKEVCALTAGPYVHIGADEAMGLDEDGFAASVRRLRALVRESGKRPIGWQESARAGAGPDDVVQHWVDPGMEPSPDPAELPAHFAEILQALGDFMAPTAHDVARATDGGARVLLSPMSHLYLDRPYDPAIVPDEQAGVAARLGMPFYRGTTVERAAAWDPASHGIPEAGIAGIETPLWAETVTGFDDAAVLLLPRMPATAETAWSGAPAAWDEYRTRIARHAPLWRALALPYLASREIPWTD